MVDTETSPDFNAEVYLLLNPDVAEAGVDPTEHFRDFGSKEGRPYIMPVLEPTVPEEPLPPDFDAGVYLALNPDVAEAGVDATEHFREFGSSEGRPYVMVAETSSTLADPIPDDFNADVYLRLNPDVASSGMDAAEHFRDFGLQEGRPYRLDSSTRLGLTTQAIARGAALEIGPFCNPVLIGDNVSYFDIMNRNDLITRAKAIGYPIKHAPEIEYVSPVGDLSIIDRQFDSVLSAHCIEHQPDLIKHLNAVSAILDNFGAYFLIIPDKRYCFDAGLDVSNIGEVVAAHVEGRSVHTLASVIEHVALTTHNEPSRHWQGDSFDAGYEDSIVQRVKAAVETWKRSGGSYIDVHAWQFTPMSFGRIITQLHALNYTDFVVDELNEPIPGTNEFTAILKKA